MADGSPIEWTNATWNPVTGCSIVSKGCTNCYAMQVAGRMEAISIAHEARHGGDPGPMLRYGGTTEQTRRGKSVWTGKINLVPEVLTAPLRWKKPRRIFVNSMSDLFHEGVPDEWIDKVFAVMALCPQHSFQVLTKRPARMRAYLSNQPQARRRWEDVLRTMGIMHRSPAVVLRNVWLGTSVEDQGSANERIPELLATPAAVRFISAEPLLGPVDMIWALCGLDWVIVGGESGPGARPMHPDWARSLRDQCADAGTPFFFKQWGEWLGGRWEDDGDSGWFVPADGGGRRPYRDAGIEHWFDRESWPIGPGSMRLGRKSTGRLLDRIEHNAMPEAKSG